MIELQVDFSLLNKFFGIPPQKVQQYANMNFEEIMEAEAEQGNSKAEEYKKILSDPDKLLEIFKLSNVENKLIILQNMSESDVDNLLIYLTPEQLSMGLNFFTDEKIMSMCQELPTETLSNMVLEKFNVVDILSLMEEDSMDKFIKQPDIERRYAQSYFEGMDQKSLEKIMINSLGSEYEGKTKGEYLTNLEKMEDDDYQRFLLSLERNNKIGLINGIIDQDNKLLYLIDNKDISRPMELLMKEDKIKMMGNLEQEFLIPMIKELPENLTQIVMTQIDPRDFADVMAEDFKDILSKVVLFSTKGG